MFQIWFHILRPFSCTIMFKKVIWNRFKNTYTTSMDPFYVVSTKRLLEHTVGLIFRPPEGDMDYSEECMSTLENLTHCAQWKPVLARILSQVHSLYIVSMVLILDGNSEIGAHVRSNLCYFICLRHLIRSRARNIS